MPISVNCKCKGVNISEITVTKIKITAAVINLGGFLRRNLLFKRPNIQKITTTISNKLTAPTVGNVGIEILIN